MLVIPQLSNYRLIIGSLVVAIIALGSFALSSYSELKGHQDFVLLEKKLVENELTQMIVLYDNLKTTNEDINSQLELSRERAVSMLDSIQKLKDNTSVVTKIKSQISTLQKENKELLAMLAALSKENESLKQQEVKLKAQLKKQISLNKVSSLPADDASGTSLNLVSLEAKALRLNTFGDDSETNRSKRVNHLRVCFSISEIALDNYTDKELFIQVVNPKNNVLSDKGAIDFGNASLIYSKKTTLNKLDSNNNLCETVEADASEPFTKGTYFVNIFHKAKLLGNTTIELN